MLVLWKFVLVALLECYLLVFRQFTCPCPSWTWTQKCWHNADISEQGTYRTDINTGRKFCVTIAIASISSMLPGHASKCSWVSWAKCSFPQMLPFQAKHVHAYCNWGYRYIYIWFWGPRLRGTLSICSGTRSTLNIPRATDMIGTPGTCCKALRQNRSIFKHGASQVKHKHFIVLRAAFRILLFKSLSLVQTM